MHRRFQAFSRFLKGRFSSLEIGYLSGHVAKNRILIFRFSGQTNDRAECAAIWRTTTLEFKLNGLVLALTLFAFFNPQFYEIRR